MIRAQVLAEVLERLRVDLARDQARPDGERLTRQEVDGYLVAVSVVEDMEAGQ